MKIEYNKLVRDKIPAIIEADGGKPITKLLTGEERKRALLEKLVEEAIEMRDNPSLGERSDLAEVLHALDEEINLSPEQIEKARLEKALERGAFTLGVYLLSVEE